MITGVRFGDVTKPGLQTHSLGFFRSLIGTATNTVTLTDNHENELSTNNRREFRYVRQSQYPAIGDAGQSQLQQSKVAILGCGALGSVAAELLARAGIGTLRLIDRDIVEWSNLQRQSLYVESDAASGLAKVEAAAKHLQSINSQIAIEEHVADVTVDNISVLLNGADLVIDACDNFSLRLLLNDWSLANQTPWVHGGCVGATGQVRLFTGHAPCFRCLLPEVPGPGQVETCDTAGVIGPATHLIASLQAGEAIKWLSGNQSAVRQTVFSIDLWENRVHNIGISEKLSANCIACSDRKFEYLNATRSDGEAESLCGRDAVQIAGRIGTKIDLDGIAKRWQAIPATQNTRTQQTRFFVRLHLPETQSITLFRDGRAVVAGVRDVAHARSLYDRYVGS